MSILDIFRVAPKLTEDVFDKDSGILVKVGGFFNDLHLSDAEIMANDAKTAQMVQDFAVATLSENTVRSKARRYIAVEWFGLQVWLIKLSVLSVFLDYLVVEIRDGESNLFESISTIAFSPYLLGITGSVSLFFFGTHALRASKFSGGDK